jgi:uncharacterized protein
MKRVLLFAAILLIAGGCATKKINYDKLQDRNGLLYMVNNDEPFTGEIVSYRNGKIELEGNVKDGLKEGLWIYYYPNGQKKMEGIYKDGLKEGTWTYWQENGMQENLEKYKLGTKLGNDVETTDGSISGGDQNTEESATGENTDNQIKGNLGSQKKTSNTKSTSGTGGTIGGDQTTTKKKETKPRPVEWSQLTGGPVKYYRGTPYTGPVVKYYREGTRGKYIDGYFKNGHRSGKWTYYHRDGRVKDIKYY